MAATLTKEQILDGIAELSVIELSELLKEFEEKFGVSAAAVAVAPGSARRRHSVSASAQRGHPAAERAARERLQMDADQRLVHQAQRAGAQRSEQRTGDRDDGVGL